MQKVMNAMGDVDEAQSVLMPNKLITINAIVAFEIFHNLQRSSVVATHHMAI